MISQTDIFHARILIVDDQPVNVELLEFLLSSTGYKAVTSTTNPREVAGWHAQHHYDLIILDLQMPGMSGFEVMDALRPLEADSWLPVLVVTAQPDHKLRALEAGARDFLSKPFDPVEVLTRIRNMLEVRLLHREARHYNARLEQTVRERTVELQRFRSAMDATADAIFLLDPARAELVDVNDGACRMLGYPRDEMLGQTAISAALSRLRNLFDDPLFVRTGRSMEPTARAIEIFALLSPALDSISTAVSRASEFNPATSTSVFRIGLSDDVEFALLPLLLKRLRAEAPGIVLVIRRVNYILMPPLLASGEISVGVSYTSDLPANAKRKVLRRSRPKLLRADTMPGPLSLDDFCERPHALVSFAGDLSGFIDTELEKMGRKRHVVLAVPQFNGLSTLLAGTDIIATVPDYTAEALTAAGGVRAEDPPLDTQSFELHMAWRGAQDNDPGERWLRSRIQMFFGDPDSL